VTLMAGTPTTKNVNLGAEDKARKEKMVEALKARNLLSPSAERFILSGRR
jgi:hypothetical protein